MSKAVRILRRYPVIIVPPVIAALALLFMAVMGMNHWLRLVLPFALGMILWPFALVLAIVIASLFGTKYKRLFADDHVVELARRLEGAKAASLALLERPYEGQMKFRDDAAREQGNLFETAAHLCIYYTIDRDAGGYLHHLSMSYTRGPLAQAGVEHFSAIIGELLTIDIRQAEISQSSRMIGHIEFVLSETEQRGFASRAVVIPSGSDIAALRKKARETVQDIRNRQADARSLKTSSC